MPRLRASALIVAAVALATGLTGCSATVAMTPADAANDPACAAVTARLPDTLDGQSRRWTDAQATGAWGTPTTVLLTCGITPPGPSTLPCESAGRVDWLIDDAEAPRYRFTTFGRTPAVEVYLDYDVVSARTVLDALASAVEHLPSDGSACTQRPSS